MARECQQTSSCQGPRGGKQGTEGSSSLSPHLAPASVFTVAAGAAPLWAQGIINPDQCSLEDSALTGRCHYWTLSIVRQRATAPEGVGESIGSCRGDSHWMPDCCLVPQGQVLIKQSLGCGRLACPSEWGEWKNWHPSPQFKTAKHTETLLILSGNRSNTH